MSETYIYNHPCSLQELKWEQENDLEIGLAYINAILKVFAHLSNTSITAPNYIFRGLTQRYFTSSNIIKEDIQNNILSNSNTEFDSIRQKKECPQSADSSTRSKWWYNKINQYVIKKIADDSIHRHGDSQLYAKYILSLINDKTYYFKYVKPLYIRSAAAVRLNGQMTSHRHADYLWYIQGLINEAKRLYPNQTLKDDLDILADLQHNGASTCLVDFSRNILTSLWFATSDFNQSSEKSNHEEENFNNDCGETGYLLCYDINSDSILKDSLELLDKHGNTSKSIATFLRDTKRSVKYSGDSSYKFYLWTPNNINSRIIRQDSVFLFGIEPFDMEKHGVIAIPIPFCWKKYIQMTLKSLFGISSESLYADPSGYANSNGKFTSLSIGTPYFNDKFFMAGESHECNIESFDLFQKGTGCLMNGDYQHALDYFYAFESVNKTWIIDVSEANNTDLENTIASINLHKAILFLELIYSKAICYKHIDSSGNENVIFYQKALDLSIILKRLYKDNVASFEQNIHDNLNGKFNHATFIDYISQKLLKITDNYIGSLINLQYFIKAYDTIKQLQGIIASNDNWANELLGTAMNELIALSCLYNNSDASNHCNFIPTHRINIDEIDVDSCHSIFCLLLNSLFEQIKALCEDDKHENYSQYISRLHQDYITCCDALSNELVSDVFGNKLFTA